MKASSAANGDAAIPSAAPAAPRASSSPEIGLMAGSANQPLIAIGDWPENRLICLLSASIAIASDSGAS